MPRCGLCKRKISKEEPYVTLNIDSNRILGKVCSTCVAVLGYIRLSKISWDYNDYNDIYKKLLSAGKDQLNWLIEQEMKRGIVDKWERERKE